MRIKALADTNIIEILKEWAYSQSRINEMEARLDGLYISKEEFIAAEAYKKAQSKYQESAGKPSGTSDPTYEIVQKTQQRLQQLNNENITRLVNDIADLKDKKAKVDYALQKLDFKYAELIRLHYGKGLTFVAVAVKLEISERQIYNWNIKALVSLASLMK